jgi:hypothetical protein
MSKMLGPFDPLAISAGLATNLIYDILKNKTQSSQNTLVGRMLHWGGFKEASFDERLRDILTRALALYLKGHSEYDLRVITDFFRNPTVAKQIGDYILDRQPIDEQRLQQLFVQHQQSGYAVSNALMQDRGLSADKIIKDFLKCYCQVLSEQLSIPEMGLLLDLFDQNASTVQEMRDSEERLKQHIDTLVQTKLSSASLHAAYQIGQQQLATSAAQLVQATQATQTGNIQIQPLPRLFTDGLCKGRPLHPSPEHYFVSHGFDANKLADWRQAIAETLAHINHSSQPLQPYFSGDKLLAGYRLCSICERIYSTNFSLFLLPATQDRNVYLELGIAIGLGKPFFLILDRGAQIPLVLTSLIFYTHSGSFRTMRRELAGQIEEYDFAAVQFTRDTTSSPILPRYLVFSGESFDDEDFEESIAEAIKTAYPQPQLTMFPVSQHLKKMQGFDLRQLVELIQTSRFSIYRVDEQSPPTTFLALGMSIGLNRPFIMISPQGSQIPENLRGLGIYQFASYVELERNMVQWHRGVLDQYVKQA